ncbi:MAG: two-partner secretion domain-containing protein, partial [Betaproteobacteria bacterium]
MLGSLAAAVALAFAPPEAHAQPAANALPSGGRVSAGEASIRQAGAAMAIQQSSARAAIDWQTFNVGSAASVTFAQPSASAIALNRVVGADPSQIFGRLSANGQVFLTNPNGVLFGPGAQVDVGGLLASTLAMSVDDFMSGRYLLRGGGSGAIVNHGTLRALPKGYVAMIAPKVVNEGTVDAPRGSAAMVAASAATVDFMADGLIRIKVDAGALDAEIANKGAIRADGGAVLLTAKALDNLGRAVVNNSGIIEARTVENVNGVIRLSGNRISNSGEIRAAGGKVTIEARANESSKGATGFENRGVVSAATVEIHSEGRDYAFGVANYGEIRAAEAASIAARDTTLVNSGTISTDKGGRVDLAGELVSLAGTLSALAGTVTVQARSVYHTGHVDVSSAASRGGEISINTERAYDAAYGSVLAADGLEGGRITLNGGAFGRVLTSGEISAKGSSGKGGEVFVSAWNATAMGATIDADGKTQGGRILFGGGKGGDGREIPLATHAMLTPGARVRARGETGGEIIVYGKASLDFYGDAEAQGAPGTRNGGFVELSSAGDWRLASQSKIDAGAGGTLLIDPKNITIDASGADVLGLARLALKLSSGSSTAAGSASTLSLSNSDGFGIRVALAADRLAVGAWLDDTGGTDRGAVYLFDGLGTSGKISTPRLALKLAHGTPLASGGLASALSLSNTDQFGAAVALAADRLAVGALQDDTGGTDRGAVYLFDGLGSSGTLATPRLAFKLAHDSALASGGASSSLALSNIDWFGASVALSGDRLAVGAHNDDTGGTDRGAIYLFDGLGSSGTIGTPRLALKLAHGTALAAGGVASTLSLSDGDFFHTVALAADRLAVGAHFDDTGGTNRGAVYLFDGLGSSGTIGTPRLAMKLAHGSTLAAGGAASTLSLVDGGLFGTVVALSADRLAVGAHTEGTGGAVYLFDGVGTSGTVATPRLAAKLANGSTLASGGTLSTLSLTSGDGFGIGVALSADRLAVSASFDDTGGTDRGAVYLFDGLGSSGAISTPRLATKLASGSAPAAGSASTLSLLDSGRFGNSVALSEDRLAVGADADHPGGSTRGAVYLFDGLGSSGTIATPRLAFKLAHGSAFASGGVAS